MMLSKKVTIIVGVTFLVIVALLHTMTSYIVLGSFAELEEQTVRTNVQRALNVFDDELAEIKKTAGDWAPWNDTRDFVVGTNKSYIENNLIDETLVNLGLNFMLFFDVSGRMVYGKGVDLVNETETRVSSGLIDYLLNQNSLLKHADSKDSHTGIILLPDGPVLISAWPISNNDFKGPIHGTLVAGRYLSDERIKKFMKKTQMKIGFAETGSAELPPDYHAARSRLSAKEPVVIKELSADVIGGYAELADIFGKPCLVLKVEMNRDIIQQGKFSTSYFMLVILIAGAVVLGVLLVTLQMTILGPISKLTGHILAVEKSGDLWTRITMKRRDEIGILANEFDNLIGQLKKNSEELETANAKLKDDIAERRRAEVALRESEATLRSIFLAAPTGIGMVSDRILKQVNARLCSMLGYSADELIGQSARMLYPSREEYEWVGKEKYEQIKRKGTGTVETRWRHKSGRFVDVVLSSTPIDPENLLSGVTFTALDVTERKAAERERKYLEERLARSQKMEALGLLAGGVAHDLNNVLSGIVSYPDLILMELDDDSPLRKPLFTIQDSGKKAAAIVQDLLTLARRGVTNTKVLNLNRVISEYFESPEHDKICSYSPDVDFEISLAPELLNIRGSSVHLKKTIMNLISNAVEALPGGGKIVVSTRNRYVDKPIKGYDEVKEGDFVVVKIEDNGIGIAPDDLKRIFEPFYTKKIMGRSGTGLGMSVVWGTIQDHKGYINVESVLGKGSTFELYYPVTRECDEMEKGVVSLDDFCGRGESILVVDDVKGQREIATEMLKRLGYTVASVSSGENAVEYLKKHSIDLLILDMIMDPGIDGYETYKRIYELHPGQKAIITSGFSETDRLREAQKLGAGPYISKPYTMRKLGLAVKNELDR